MGLADWHPLSGSAFTVCMLCREPAQRNSLQLTPLEDLLGRLHAQVSARSSHHVPHIIRASRCLRCKVHIHEYMCCVLSSNHRGRPACLGMAAAKPGNSAMFLQGL